MPGVLQRRGLRQPGGAPQTAAVPGVTDQGPVVTFNMLRPDGQFVGYRWARQHALLFYLRQICVQSG